MSPDQPAVQYVEARRALLDALTALQPHIGAFVLIGAQAVYVRTAGRLPGYQPFTTDADLALTKSFLTKSRAFAFESPADGFNQIYGADLAAPPHAKADFGVPDAAVDLLALFAKYTAGHATEHFVF